jgi:hypothetical protein
LAVHNPNLTKSTLDVASTAALRDKSARHSATNPRATARRNRLLETDRPSGDNG